MPFTFQVAAAYSNLKPLDTRGEIGKRARDVFAYSNFNPQATKLLAQAREILLVFDYFTLNLRPMLRLKLSGLSV